MAQELVINTWCDVCQERGDRQEGHPVEAFGRLIDMCDRDEKELVTPLAEVVARLGRRPDAKPSPVTRKSHAVPVDASWVHRHPCPIDGTIAPTSSALSSHLARVHDASSAQVFGDMCPLCGAMMGDARGLGTHIARAHAAPGVASAFDQAAAIGDPHGVVAARAAAGWGL